MHRLQYGTQRLQQVSVVKSVGAEIDTRVGEKIDKQRDRLAAAKEVASMLQWASLPFGVRADLLMSMVVPR
eukprot:6202207-Karenia_brevis.AAC.1